MNGVLSCILSAWLIVGSATAGHATERERREQRDLQKARSTLEEFARCVASKNPKESARTLRLDLGSTRGKAALNALAREGQNCAERSLLAGGALRSDRILFAGSVAEALVEAESGAINVRLMKTESSELPRYASVDIVAQCLCRSLPDQVGALLSAGPGTEAEEEAANQIFAAVEPCSTAEGVSERLELTLPALRAVTAIAAFRLLANIENAHA